ncbi:hypothetical protein AVEN_110944-1 [Araneus ventricosus]|uniref:Uncharacterized protein n=1 Tax=Araneus ventricosus TaxID=182803 RepID=A0A4Y2HDA5_ARAVE|nr:hypothetical protein AVEN_110944-1 [Araneus ventricosus]
MRQQSAEKAFSTYAINTFGLTAIPTALPLVNTRRMFPRTFGQVSLVITWPLHAARSFHQRNIPYLGTSSSQFVVGCSARHPDRHVMLFQHTCPAPLECHISRTMDRTWRTCVLASSLTGHRTKGLFLLGHMKSLLYETPVDSAEDLVARIAVAADKNNTTPGIFGRVRQSFLRRFELRNDTRGRHFQNLV